MPLGLKVDKMAIKIIHLKTLENLPKLGFFWFENIPSGNTGFGRNRKNPHSKEPILFALGNKLREMLFCVFHFYINL
jgi:hypothetical protein